MNAKTRLARSSANLAVSTTAILTKTRQTRRSLLLLATIMLSVLISSRAFTQNADAVSVVPAIGGYSPVSYFTEDKAERGDPAYSVEHNGQTYFLTSAAQVSTFWKDPGKYKPRHKACPYSLAFGMTLPLDPTNFKIVGDSLLLFHLSEEKDALLEWNNSELSEDELLRRADANAFLVKF